MKYIWRILAIVNVVAVLALLVCAYSVYLNPSVYPNWSYVGMVFPVPLIITVIFLLFWLFFKIKYALISVVGMLLCIDSIRTYCPVNLFRGEPEGNTIKLLSYNVMYLDGRPTSDNPITQYILSSGADIVCLQEPPNILNQPIHGTLSTVYPYIEACYQGTACVVMLSKLPIIECHSLGIKSSTNLSCVFNLLLGDDTLSVINSHLESYRLDDHDKENYGELFHNLKRLPQERRRTEIKDKVDSLEQKLADANRVRAVQADSIDAFVARCSSKYIVSCGDFNDSPISYVHRIMSRHLNDAYTRSGNGVGFSYNRNRMYFRIDNILVNDSFTPYNAKVDNSIRESDHYPIVCTLEY